MILALDSYYKDNICNTSLVVFISIHDDVPYYKDTIYTEVTSEYIPGEFYKRELPGIIKILEKLQKERPDIWKSVTILITDSFITLKTEDKEWGGLGYHLKEYLNSIGCTNKIIYGVAKSNFGCCEKISKLVYRGKSKTPLYVQSTHKNNTAAGVIHNMHGEYRIPTMLKLVDQLSRIFPDNKG